MPITCTQIRPHLGRTPGSSRVIQYLDHLAQESPPPVIYPSQLARKLSTPKCPVHRATVYYLAMRKGFKTATKSQATKTAKETTASRRVHDYFNKLENKLREKGILPKDFVIYPAEVARELSTPECSVHRKTVRLIAIREGFQIATRSEAAKTALETPASRRIHDYFNNLKNELREEGILPKDFTIYPSKLARKLSTLECSVHCETVRSIAIREGFKIATKSEAIKIAMETTASRRVHSYFDDLENKLREKGILPEDFVIYPTKLARELSTPEYPVRRETIYDIAMQRGFRTATRSEARQIPDSERTALPSRAVRLSNRDGGNIDPRDSRARKPDEILQAREQEAELNQARQALADTFKKLKKTNHTAYIILSLRFGLNPEDTSFQSSEELTPGSIAKILSMRVYEVEAILYRSLRKLRQNLDVDCLQIE